MENRKKYIVFFLLLLILIPLNKLFAADPLCDGSIKNNLWPKVLFKEDVKNLQRFLNTEGYIIPVTGIYSTQTQKFIKEYQRENKMLASGAVGYITRLLINQKICNQPIENFDPGYNNVSFVKNDKDKEFIYLKTPLIEQSYRLSCEAASVEMALSFKNISKNQTQILNLFGKAKPYDLAYQDETLIWADPDEGFVGNVTGYFLSPDKNINLNRLTGFGINNGPVAKTVQRFLPKSEEIDQASNTKIREELRLNNPVIFWYRPSKLSKIDISYKTPKGEEKIFKNIHVAVITGFRISNTNEISYLINDPIYGRFIISDKELDDARSEWNRDIVVVR